MFKSLAVLVNVLCKVIPKVLNCTFNNVRVGIPKTNWNSAAVGEASEYVFLPINALRATHLCA